MAWGGARPGAGRKPVNRPKLKATTKVKARPTVDATPRQAPTYSMAAVEAVIRASAEAAGARNRAPEFNPFQLPKFPEKAMPPEANRMAMDENFTWASGEWAQAVLQGVTAEGLLFLGYPYLSELDCMEDLTAEEGDQAREALIAAMDADPAIRAYRGHLEEHPIRRWGQQ